MSSGFRNSSDANRIREMGWDNHVDHYARIPPYDARKKNKKEYTYQNPIGGVLQAQRAMNRKAQQRSGIDILGIKSFDDKRKLHLEMKTAKLILVREGLKSSLRELVDNRGISSKELIAVELVNDMRVTSLELIECILEYELLNDNEPFLYKKELYLKKMCNDLIFLADSPLFLSILHCYPNDLYCNPLLLTNAVNNPGLNGVTASDGSEINITRLEDAYKLTVEKLTTEPYQQINYRPPSPLKSNYRQQYSQHPRLPPQPKGQYQRNEQNQLFQRTDQSRQIQNNREIIESSSTSNLHGQNQLYTQDQSQAQPQQEVGDELQNQGKNQSQFKSRNEDSHSTQSFENSLIYHLNSINNKVIEKYIIKAKSDKLIDFFKLICYILNPDIQRIDDIVITNILLPFQYIVDSLKRFVNEILTDEQIEFIQNSFNPDVVGSGIPSSTSLLHLLTAIRLIISNKYQNMNHNIERQRPVTTNVYYNNRAQNNDYNKQPVPLRPGTTNSKSRQNYPKPILQRTTDHYIEATNQNSDNSRSIDADTVGTSKSIDRSNSKVDDGGGKRKDVKNNNVNRSINNSNNLKESKSPYQDNIQQKVKSPVGNENLNKEEDNITFNKNKSPNKSPRKSSKSQGNSPHTSKQKSAHNSPQKSKSHSHSPSKSNHKPKSSESSSINSNFSDDKLTNQDNSIHKPNKDNNTLFDNDLAASDDSKQIIPPVPTEDKRTNQSRDSTKIQSPNQVQTKENSHTPNTHDKDTHELSGEDEFDEDFSVSLGTNSIENIQNKSPGRQTSPHEPVLQHSSQTQNQYSSVQHTQSSNKEQGEKNNKNNSHSDESFMFDSTDNHIKDNITPTSGKSLNKQDVVNINGKENINRDESELNLHVSYLSSPKNKVEQDNQEHLNSPSKDMKFSSRDSSSSSTQKDNNNSIKHSIDDRSIHSGTLPDNIRDNTDENQSKDNESKINNHGKNNNFESNDMDFDFDDKPLQSPEKQNIASYEDDHSNIDNISPINGNKKIGSVRKQDSLNSDFKKSESSSNSSFKSNGTGSSNKAKIESNIVENYANTNTNDITDDKLLLDKVNNDVETETNLELHLDDDNYDEDKTQYDQKDSQVVQVPIQDYQIPIQNVTEKSRESQKDKRENSFISLSNSSSPNHRTSQGSEKSKSQNHHDRKDSTSSHSKDNMSSGHNDIPDYHDQLLQENSKTDEKTKINKDSSKSNSELNFDDDYDDTKYNGHDKLEIDDEYTRKRSDDGDVVANSNQHNKSIHKISDGEKSSDIKLNHSQQDRKSNELNYDYLKSDESKHDRKSSESKHDDRKPIDSKQDDTKSNESKRDDIQSNKSKYEDTKSNDSKHDDRKSKESKHDDTKTNEPKNDDRETNESKTSDVSDSSDSIFTNKVGDENNINTNLTNPDVYKISSTDDDQINDTKSNSNPDIDNLLSLTCFLSPIYNNFHYENYYEQKSLIKHQSSSEFIYHSSYAVQTKFEMFIQLPDTLSSGNLSRRIDQPSTIKPNLSATEKPNEIEYDALKQDISRDKHSNDITNQPENSNLNVISETKESESNINNDNRLDQNNISDEFDVSQDDGGVLFFDNNLVIQPDIMINHSETGLMSSGDQNLVKISPEKDNKIVNNNSQEIDISSDSKIDFDYPQKYKHKSQKDSDREKINSPITESANKSINDGDNNVNNNSINDGDNYATNNLKKSDKLENIDLASPPGSARIRHSQRSSDFERISKSSVSNHNTSLPSPNHSSNTRTTPTPIHADKTNDTNNPDNYKSPHFDPDDIHLMIPNQDDHLSFTDEELKKLGDKKHLDTTDDDST